MTRRLDGKIALITGGAAGIGEACVRRFVAEGACVLIGDVDGARGAALARELGSAAVFQPLDVADGNSFAAAIDAAVKKWGRLDILLNNAGVAVPAEPLQETSDADFDKLINTNLRSVFLGCKRAYPHLKKSRGCVLNISSMSAVTGQERHAVYGATKGGINALTKCAAVDWAGDGIRVNALCPTGVLTETLKSWAKTQPLGDGAVAKIGAIHLLNRCAEPAEVAAVAAFLCSDDASFVTGCVMPVSGGSECGYGL